MRIDKDVLKELYDGYSEMLGAIGYQLDLDIDNFIVKISDISGKKLSFVVEEGPIEDTKIICFKGSEKEIISLDSTGEFEIVYPNGLTIHLGYMYGGPNIKIVSPKEDGRQQEPYTTLNCDTDIIEFILGRADDDENTRSIHVRIDKNIHGKKETEEPDEIFIVQEKIGDEVKAHIESNDVFSSEVTPIQADVGIYYGLILGHTKRNDYVAPLNTKRAYDIVLPAFRMLLNAYQYTKEDKSLSERLDQLLVEREMIENDRDRINQNYEEDMARLEENLRKTDAAIEACRLELLEKSARRGEDYSTDGISIDAIDRKIEELQSRVDYATSGFAYDPDVTDARNSSFEPENVEPLIDQINILREIKDRIRTM